MHLPTQATDLRAVLIDTKGTTLATISINAFKYNLRYTEVLFRQQ